jgi:hypothetical protein
LCRYGCNGLEVKEIEVMKEIKEIKELGGLAVTGRDGEGGIDSFEAQGGNSRPMIALIISYVNYK